MTEIMAEMQKSELEEAMGKNIASIHVNTGGNSLSSNYIIMLDDGNFYSVKYVNLSSGSKRILKSMEKNERMDGIVAIEKVFRSRYFGKDCVITPYYEGITMKEWVHQREDILSGKDCMKCTAEKLRLLHNTEYDNWKWHSTALDWWKEYISYRTCLKKRGICSRHSMQVFSWLNQKILAVKNERPVLLHGDANLSNFIVNRDGEVRFIDFENMKCGDVSQDLVYAAVLHKREEDLFWFLFLHYYFAHHIQDDFWKRVKVYAFIRAMAMDICDGIRNRRKISLFHLENVYESYESLEKTIPDWYLILEKKKEDMKICL